MFSFKYKLKIIIRARSINNKLLGPINVLIVILYASLFSLIMIFFFNKNNLNSGELWTNLNLIFIKYRVVSLIDGFLEASLAVAVEQFIDLYKGKS